MIFKILYGVVFEDLTPFPFREGGLGVRSRRSPGRHWQAGGPEHAHDWLLLTGRRQEIAQHAMSPLGQDRFRVELHAKDRPGAVGDGP